MHKSDNCVSNSILTKKTENVPLNTMLFDDYPAFVSFPRRKLTADAGYQISRKNMHV